jgi:hypothetical protein
LTPRPGALARKEEDIFICVLCLLVKVDGKLNLNGGGRKRRGLGCHRSVMSFDARDGTCLTYATRRVRFVAGLVSSPFSQSHDEIRLKEQSRSHAAVWSAKPNARDICLEKAGIGPTSRRMIRIIEESTTARARRRWIADHGVKAYIAWSSAWKESTTGRA